MTNKRSRKRINFSQALKLGAFAALLALMFALGGRIVSTTGIATEPEPTEFSPPASIDINDVNQALCYRACSLIR